jgi:hypothetical protein
MPESIGFGATPTAIELIRLSRQIKTFAEGTDERSTPIDAIRHRLAEARRVVFLGFAFHRMNVDLILPPTSPIEKTFARRVFGTGLGLSANDIEDITSELKERLHTTNNGTVQLVAKLTCHDLFHEFRRGLAFV